MYSDAARIIASDRPIVWSRDYELSQGLAATLEERGLAGIFYGELNDFRFPSRILITRSTSAAFIGSSWQSPVLLADGSEVARAAELLKSYPNIASITVIDKELELKPFQELS
jgi:hypothetical protein